MDVVPSMSQVVTEECSHLLPRFLCRQCTPMSNAPPPSRRVVVERYRSKVFEDAIFERTPAHHKPAAKADPS